MKYEVTLASATHYTHGGEGDHLDLGLGWLASRWGRVELCLFVFLDECSERLDRERALDSLTDQSITMACLVS